MIPGCLRRTKGCDASRMHPVAAHPFASEGARGPNSGGERTPRAKGAAKQGRTATEEGDGVGEEKEGGDGERVGGEGRGGSSQATASRHNSELPRCEGRIDSIALTLYAPALCIYVNA